VEALVREDVERALCLVDEAEQLARTIADPEEQAWALARVSAALTRAKEWDRAEQLARTIADPEDQAWALVEVVEALVREDVERALCLVDEAEQLARTIADPEEQACALVNVAEALALASKEVSPNNNVRSKEPADMADGVLRSRACRLTALVLATDQWREALLLATRLAPEATLRAHDVLTRAWVTG
jgi:hypothetical protein